MRKPRVRRFEMAATGQPSLEQLAEIDIRVASRNKGHIKIIVNGKLRTIREHTLLAFWDRARVAAGKEPVSKRNAPEPQPHCPQT